MIQSSYYQTKEKIVLKCFTSFFTLVHCQHQAPDGIKED